MCAERLSRLMRIQIGMGKKVIWLVLFSVCFLSAGVYLSLSEKHAAEIRNDKKIHQSVEAQLTKIASQVNTSINKFQFGLRGLLGALETTGFDNFNYQKQLSYFNSRDYATEFPGARGFGVIKLVKKSDLEQFIHDASIDRGRDFTIKQLDAPKDPLLIIQYIEPEGNNAAAVGLDIGSEINRRTAALDAARLGELQLTGPITLVQANNKTKHGFLLLYPIYKKTSSGHTSDVLGWVYAPLLITEILDTVSALNDLFSIQIADKTALDEVNFYASSVHAEELEQYQMTIQTAVFGRNWAVSVTPTARFLNSLALENPQHVFWQIIIATITINFLLIASSYFFANRLLKLRQQIAFNNVVNNASDGIIGVDNNFAIQHWNEAANQLFDFTTNSAINKPLVHWLGSGIQTEKLIDYFKKVASGEALRNIRFHFHSTLNDTTKELLIHLSPIYQNGEFRGATVIFNDLTEINQLQQRLESTNVDLEKKIQDSTFKISRQLNLQKSILDSNRSIIIGCDKTGLISLFNQSAESLLGCLATEVEGKTNIVSFLVKQRLPIDLSNNELPKDFYQNLLSFSSTQKHLSLDCSLLTKTGDMLDVFLIITELKDKYGVEDGYVFTAIDQSEKLGLENQVSLMSAAVDNSQDFLFWLSVEGNIINANPYATQNLEHIFSSQLITAIADIMTFKQGESWPSLATKIVENHLFTFEAELNYPQKMLPVLVSGCTIKINGKSFIYLAAKSIVERLEKENQLQSAMLKAELANKAKTQFIANMSHELRTPLNAAKGFLQLLEFTPVDEIQKKHIAGSQKAINSLTQTIDEILEATSAEQNQLTLDQCDFILDELLNEIGLLLYEMSDGKPIEIHIHVAPETPLTLYGDKNKLKRILINIAGNAVKFTHKGEVLIDIGIQQLKNKSFKLVVVIKDTGIGIEEAKLESIFDAFSQANNESNREYGGLGIGLTVADRYVRFLGGRVVISSQVGVGSQIQFDVLMSEGKQAQNSKLAIIPEQKVNVLLVDDNQTSLRILSAIINQLGWNVTTADNATDALLLFESALNHQEPFDLALIDWKMPETDGWELAALFRKVTTSNRLPLMIMVTAHSKEMFNHQHESSPKLFNGFLTKPVTRVQLIETFYDAFASAKDVNEVKADTPKVKPLLEMRILLVDDNPINLEVAKTLLENQGANVVSVSGGKEAIFELENSLLPFDVVLMDIQMPVMDGYEATQRIRGIDKFVRLPIIAMTANVLPSDKEKCFAVGMNEHIGKPIELNDMVGKILTITNNASLQPVYVDIPADIAEKTDVIAFCDDNNVDFNNAMTRFNHLDSLYLKSLEFFTSDIAKYIEQLESTNIQHSDLKIMFHTLKGTAAALGFVDLTEFAKEQEKKLIGVQAEKFDVAQFNTCADTFRAALQVVNGLIVLLNKTAVLVSPASVPMIEFDETYAQLKSEINSFNMQAIDTFQKIATSLKSLSPELADQLISALNSLKFKNAKDIMLEMDSLIGTNDNATK